MFAAPYVDVDEWRDRPVRHRYLHGGFADTETRFSMYLPPPDLYEGRFFQHITPVPDNECLAQGAVRRAGQDRVFHRERRLLPGDERWGRLRAAGFGDRPHDRGVSGQCGRSAVRASRGSRDVRRTPAVRLCLRREWRRLPHHRECREHIGRLGRLRAVRHRVADGHSEHVHRADARTKDFARPFRSDRRCRRTGWERRHVRWPHGRGVRCPDRGHPHGLPAAVMVRAPHHGDARFPGAVRGPASPRTPPTSTSSGPNRVTSDSRRRPRWCTPACNGPSKSSRR